MDLSCPKCGSKRSWLEEIDNQLAHRCICGLMRFLVRETPEGFTVMHKAVKSVDVRLPPQGTKLYTTLLGVALSHPNSVCTRDVAEKGALTNKETASLMMLLLARGLVIRVMGRKGMEGGSLWALTDETATLMCVREV